MRVANLLLLAGAAAAAFPLATSRAVADGIPCVVMTNSQYLTDWSGVYVGGKLRGRLRATSIGRRIQRARQDKVGHIDKVVRCFLTAPRQERNVLRVWNVELLREVGNGLQ